MYLISDKSSQLNNHKSLDGNRHLLTEVWIKGVLILSHTTTLYQTVCTSNGKQDTLTFTHMYEQHGITQLVNIATGLSLFEQNSWEAGGGGGNDHNQDCVAIPILPTLVKITYKSEVYGSTQLYTCMRMFSRGQLAVHFITTPTLVYLARNVEFTFRDVCHGEAELKQALGPETQVFVCSQVLSLTSIHNAS